jgi:acyl-CoA reductase-like NAD-dependent aldehyde dehydrogenase
LEQYKLFINGKFVDSASGKTFESIDPGTEAPIATVAQAGKADAEAASQCAQGLNSGAER